jgi:recombination protein RecT
MTDLMRRDDDQFAVGLFERKADFQKALGGALDAQKFLADAMSAINANPKLRMCTPESLLGALYFAAQLGLPVGGPLQQFHLTPREVWNPREKKKQWQVVPVVGYPGLIKLAMNSGEYDTIGGIVIYENDEFEKPWSDQAGKHFRHREADGDRGAIIGVVGYATVKGSNRSEIEWIPIDIIESNHRPVHWDKTPWATHTEQMVKKTGARVVSKYTAKSTAQEKFALAMLGDGAVVTKVDGSDDLDFEYDAGATEDWAALIDATVDKAELEVLYQRMGQSGELTDDLAARVLAHSATLTKDSRPGRITDPAHPDYVAPEEER